MEHIPIYDKETNEGAIYKEVVNDEEFVLVDLFPYKIKSRDSFYQRDHPENLEPNSFLWEKYWIPFARKCVEGTWVKDKDTWVFMPPKLFFFVNYTTIQDEEKNTISPWLRDIEWIFATYWLCCEGFSGFEGDPKYTSHYLAKKAHDEDLDEVERGKIPPSCYYRGKLKEYVDPWTFLTKTYLIDDPRDAPLGRPLYSPTKQQKNKPNSGITERINQKNFLTIGCRGISKSVHIMAAVAYHDFCFSGIKFWEERDQRSRPVRSVIVGPEGQAFQRSLDIMKHMHTNHPGKYVYEEDRAYRGLAYKNIQGAFTYKQGAIEHVIKEGSGVRALNGANIQMGTLKKENLDKMIGGRVENIIVEEVGLVGSFLKSLLAKSEDTLSVSGKRTGKFVGLGTSGELEKFEAVKPLFMKPNDYGIFGIPNHWENSGKNIALFMSAVYKYRDYEDDQGNMYMHASFKRFIKQYQEWSEGDSNTATIKKLNNPIMPRHAMIPNMQSLYPKEEASSQLLHIENNDLYEKFARAGALVDDYTSPYKVRFDQDSNYDRVIQEMNPDFNNLKQEGRLVIFEPVREIIPKNTYFLVLDPVSSKDGYGTSSYGLVVYKHHRSNGGWLTDGIAAVWKGRFNLLHDNWKHIIRVSKYFGNALIWFEDNSGGFHPWCRKNNLLHHLMPTYDTLSADDNPYKVKGAGIKYGYRLGRNKPYAEKRFCQWLLEERAWDEHGTILKRNIDYIYSIMFLNEIKSHTPGGNYDLISCGHGLALLLDALEEDFIPDEEPEKDYDEDPYKDKPKLGMNRGVVKSGYNNTRTFERL